MKTTIYLNDDNRHIGEKIVACDLNFWLVDDKVLGVIVKKDDKGMLIPMTSIRCITQEKEEGDLV